mmetsp:Transcript_33013/g.77883  ORF Transcript_33013/g.77883 Transcript_33013/m.77883 type:complete len:86 (-) Transcript_33013:459-716(-)
MLGGELLCWPDRVLCAASGNTLFSFMIKLLKIASAAPRVLNGFQQKIANRMSSLLCLSGPLGSLALLSALGEIMGIPASLLPLSC